MPNEEKEELQSNCPGSPLSGQSTSECSSNLHSSRKTSKVKRLRIEIEALSQEKAKLNNELDSARVTISKLESALQEKNEDINSAKIELQNAEDKAFRIGSSHTATDAENEKYMPFQDKDNLIEQRGTVSVGSDDSPVIQRKESCENLNSACSLEDREKENYFLHEIQLKNDCIDQLQNEKFALQNSNYELLSIVKNLKYQVSSIETKLYQESNINIEMQREANEIIEQYLQEIESKNLKISELLSLKDELNENISRKIKDNEELEQKLVLCYGELNGMRANVRELLILTEKYSEDKMSENKIKDQINLLEHSIFKLTEDMTRSQEEYTFNSQFTNNDVKTLEDNLKNVNEVSNTNLFESETEDIIKTLLEKEKKNLEFTAIVESYQQQISDLDKEVLYLKEILKQKEDILSEMQVKQINIQHEFDLSQKEKEKELKEKIDLTQNLQESINEWTKQNMNCNNHIQLLRSEIEEKANLIKSNENDLRDLECQNIFLTSTLQEKDAIVGSMQSSLDSMNDELISLRSKCNSMAGDIQSKAECIYQFQHQVHSLKLSLDSITFEKESLIQAIEEKENALQNCLMELHELEANLRCKLNNQEMQLQNKIKECEIMEKGNLLQNEQLYCSKRQIECLENKIKEKDEEILENINIIGKLETDLEDLKNVVNESNNKQKLDEYEYKILTQEEELNSKSSFISSLNSQIANLKSQNSILCSEKQILDMELLKSNETIKTFEEQEKNNAIQTQALKEKHEEEVNDLKSAIDEIKHCWKTSELTISRTFESDISRLMEEKVNLSHEIEKYVDKCDTQVKTIESLQQKITKCNEKEDVLLMKVKEKTDLIHTLEESLKDFEESKKLHCYKYQQLEIQMYTLKDLIRKYESKIASLEFTLKEKDNSMSSIKLSLDVLDKNTKSLQHLEMTLKESLQAKEKEVFDLQQHLVESNSKISEFQLQCRDQKQTIKSIYTTLRCLNSELNDKYKEIAQLQDEIMKIREQLLEENRTIFICTERSKLKKF